MPKGVYPRGGYKPRKTDPADVVDAVRTAYLSGASQAEIAAEHGWTLKRVQGVFRRNGITPRRQVKRDQWGPNNPRWKGTDAGYQAFHLRVERRRGTPSECQRCGTTDPQQTYDWANLSGNYPDPDDYERMCRSCHRRYDHARGGDA